MQKLISIVVAIAFAAASGAALAAEPAQKPPQKPLTENQKKEIKMSKPPGTANAQQAAALNKNKPSDPPARDKNKK